MTTAPFAALPALLIALLVGYLVFGRPKLPRLFACAADVPRRWCGRTFVHCYRVA